MPNWPLGTREPRPARPLPVSGALSPIEALSAQLSHACTILQLQAELIDSLTQQLAILRVERDQAFALKDTIRRLEAAILARP
jgi:hypothetical protein